MLKKEDQKNFKNIDFISLSSDSNEDIYENLHIIPANMYTFRSSLKRGNFSPLVSDLVSSVEVIATVSEMLEIYNNDSSNVMFVSFLESSFASIIAPINDMDLRIEKIDYLRFLYSKMMTNYNDLLDNIDECMGDMGEDNKKEMLRYIDKLKTKINKKHPAPIKKYKLKKTKNYEICNYDDLRRVFVSPKKETEKIRPISISYSFNSFYDASFLDAIYKKHGLESFKNRARALFGNYNESVGLGVGYRLYRLTESLKNAIGKDSFPILSSMVTKHPPFDSSFVSFLNHYHNISFEKMMYLGGSDRSYYNYTYKLNNPVCRSQESFDKNKIIGLSPIMADEKLADKLDLDFDLSVGEALDLLADIIKDETDLILIESIKDKINSLGLTDLRLVSESKNNNEISFNPLPVDVSDSLNLVYDYNVLVRNGERTAVFDEFKHMIEISKVALDKEIKITVILDSGEQNIDLKDFENEVYFIEYESFPEHCDIYNTSSRERAAEKINEGYPSIIMESVGLKNENNDSIVFIFDVDEVLVSGEESFYQNYHLNRFKEEQGKRIDEDFNDSPLQKYFLKISDITKLIRGIYPIEIHLLTARGGDQSSTRVMRFLERNNIIVDRVLFLDGGDKTHHIVNNSVNAVVKFIDDHPTHINRVLKNEEAQGNVVACHYPANPDMSYGLKKGKKLN